MSPRNPCPFEWRRTGKRWVCILPAWHKGRHKMRAAHEHHEEAKS